VITGDIATKTAFADTVRGTVAQFLQALERLVELQNVYIARGYNPGAADAIVDGDIAASKITAAQLSQVLESAWVVTRIAALMNEQVVSGTIQGNVIMDKVRSDI